MGRVLSGGAVVYLHHGVEFAMNYGYIRVSTEHQENSAEAQAAKLQPVCDRLFTDTDVSGSVLLKDRPEGKRLCDALAPGDTVVITTRDRAFRSLLDAIQTLAYWQKLGVRLKILDFPIDLATDEGEVMFQLLSVFASYERRLISRRTKAVLAHKRALCQPYAGLRPYGWRRDGNKWWQEFPEERKIGSLICRLVDEGLSWQEIALRLCVDGVRKPLRKRGVKGWYQHRDVVCLWRAAKAGYPVRPQSAWRGLGSARTTDAG
jgi:DNA invertase Pin-like site-specific DNA recombinase